MSAAAPPPGPAPGRAHGGLAFGLAGAAAVAFVDLMARVAVDVPHLDDYDAFLGILLRWQERPDAGERLRLLFDPHNEHVLALPRLWALGSLALLGRLDLAWLDWVAAGYLFLLLGALFSGFARTAPPALRAVAFCPALLWMLQPQFWSLLPWPTTSLSNAGVVALAALACAALARPGPWALALAASAAAGALFSQGNGVLLLPVALAVPLLRGERRRALHWAAVALALAAVYALVFPIPEGRAALLPGLGQPGWALRYALHFAGCAAAFSHRELSLLAGAALAGASLWLGWRGLPRRNPVLFALLLFLWVSIAANALLRAHQGPGAPLFQPRYRLYASLLLALTTLGGWEVLGAQARRRWAAGSLAAAGLFWLGSTLAYRDDALRLAESLERGRDLWWSSGRGGLTYPQPRVASVYLKQAYASGLLAIPARWAEDFAAPPLVRDPPAADRRVKLELESSAQDRQQLLLSGWAHAGGDAGEQDVEVVLSRNGEARVFPAFSVYRDDLPPNPPPRLRALARSGFRAVIRKPDLPPGEYRLGVLVRRAGREHLSYLREPLRVTAGESFDARRAARYSRGPGGVAKW